jgi:hypothetical protein
MQRVQVLQEWQDQLVRKRSVDRIYPYPSICSRSPKVRATQGQGLMPDKTSRFSINGQQILHFVCAGFVAILQVDNLTLLPLP